MKNPLMNKKNLLLTLMTGAFMTFTIADVLARPLASTEPLTKEEVAMTETLQKAYPANRIRSVRATPINDLWEVTMATHIAYVAANADAVQAAIVTDQTKGDLFRYWMFGASVFDMKDGRDLTADARRLAQMIDVSKLPIKNAITRVKGTGERALFVFTDPECPHCRRLEGVLEGLENVTIHTFLTPVVALHPKAREVSAAIWCAKDPQKALLDYMTGKTKDLGTAACETPLLENEKLMETLSIKGTPTLFFETGERHTGVMSIDQLQKTFAHIEREKKEKKGDVR